MNRYRAMVVKGWLVLVTVFAAGTVHAQARGPSVQEILGEPPPATLSPEKRARQLAAVEAWLRRLPGLFEIRTYVDFVKGEQFECADHRNGNPCPEVVQPNFAGLAECRGIGAGPGVSCRLDMVVTNPGYDVGGPSLRLPYYYETQHFEILFGVDAEGPEIRFMWVDPGGLNYQAQGPLSGNVVHPKCVVGGFCLLLMPSIRVTDDSGKIEMMFGGLRYELRREKPTDAAE